MHLVYGDGGLNPRGISALIHNFVWVWATEWVFFVYEVVGVFALVYFTERIDRKTHLRLTYTFAIASAVRWLLSSVLLAL